jgi:DNA-binding MarR family transcriptional regulator
LTFLSFITMTALLEQEYIYHLLTGRTPMALHRALSKQFKKNGIDLTREQWTVLAVLWQEDGCSQQELAHKTFRDKPSVTRLIDHLEIEKYIERIESETDKRINLIYLTEKGRKIQEPVMETVKNTLAIVLKDIDSEHIQMLKETLDMVFNNLEELSK